MKVMLEQDQILEAAQCLLGINDISEEWGYFEIEQFLDWALDNLEELEGTGYPMDVMNRENEVAILDQVENLIRKTNPELVGG